MRCLFGWVKYHLPSNPEIAARRSPSPDRSGSCRNGSRTHLASATCDSSWTMGPADPVRGGPMLTAAREKAETRSKPRSTAGYLRPRHGRGRSELRDVPYREHGQRPKNQPREEFDRSPGIASYRTNPATTTKLRPPPHALKTFA